MPGFGWLNHVKPHLTDQVLFLPPFGPWFWQFGATYSRHFQTFSISQMVQPPDLKGTDCMTAWHSRVGTRSQHRHPGGNPCPTPWRFLPFLLKKNRKIWEKQQTYFFHVNVLPIVACNKVVHIDCWYPASCVVQILAIFASFGIPTSTRFKLILVNPLIFRIGKCFVYDGYARFGIFSMTPSMVLFLQHWSYLCSGALLMVCYILW